MAKEFFKDLPNTTTPLTATRLNGLLDGDEALGNLVVDSIKTTNLFNKNQLIGLVQINSSGGYIADQTSYINYIEVEAGKTYTISANLNRQWVYNFSNNIPAIGSSGNTRTVAAGTSITFTVPSGYKYFCLRGYPDGASSQEYNLSQNIKLEEGSTATTFTKYQNLDNYEYYSTGEILIGTWIDGKPLYRKVIQFTTTSTSYSMATIPAPADNVDICMIDNAHSYIIDTNNNGIIYMVNTMRAGSDTTVMNTGIHNWFRINADKKIAYTVGSLLTNKPCTLTLEYTKTTD